MEDNELKKLLENMEVQPSTRCWQAIESQLPAIETIAVGTTRPLLHFSSLTTKIIVGLTAAAIIGGAVAIAFISPSEITSSPSNTPITTTIDTVTPPPIVANDTAIATTENQPAVVAAKPFINPDQQTKNTPSTPHDIEIPTRQTSSPAMPLTTASLTPTAMVANTFTAPKEELQPTKEQSVQRIVADDPVLAEMTQPTPEAAPITLTIPNVITPNGDGYNDYFIILGIEACDQHRLIIKNRSGQIVFQSTNYQNNWDAGQLPEGTYQYQFAYKVHGIEEVRTGILTILR